jgi:uncharacterized protein with FMN-binding domain
MNRKLKRVLWVLMGIVAIGILVISWAAVDPIRYRNLIVKDVSLENLPDGIYTGSFKGGRFANSVEVTIKDHKIAHIRNTKPSAQAKKLHEQIYDRVMEEQSLAIDTVSGASVTTKTALKAIENALSLDKN